MRRTEGKKRSRRRRTGKISRVMRNDVASTSRGSTYVNRRDGKIAPDVMYGDLHFYELALLRNVGALFADLRYIANGVFDVDPTLGSTAIAGFSELAQIYSSYRPVSCKVTVDFCNLEAFPTTVYLVIDRQPSNDPGANNAGGLDWLMNPYSNYRQLSLAGGQDRVRLSRNFDFPTIFSKQVLSDDSYSAAVTANPALKIYHVVGSNTAVNQVSGVECSVHYVIRAMFYAPKLLTT